MTQPIDLGKWRRPELTPAKRERLRFYSVVLKWSSIVLGFAYALWAGLWAVLFVWIPWLLEYNFKLLMAYIGAYGTGQGLMGYLQRSGVWWSLWALGITILLAFEYYTHYSHKRRKLKVSEGVEGRVVWIKGVRQGLLYDVWDAYNYVKWALGSKKEGAWLRGSMGPGQTPGMRSPPEWPDPWAIPFGPSVSGVYVVYLKRRFLSWPDILLVDRSVKLSRTFFTYSLPLGRWLKVANPGLATFPQRAWVYIYTQAPLRRYEVDPANVLTDNRSLLDDSRSLVKDAIESDPETVKGDYERGSLRLPLLRE